MMNIVCISKDLQIHAVPFKVLTTDEKKKFAMN